MALDETALRGAGLPASLISLLVSITKAAERAQAAANTAATANDLAPQISAAVQVLQEMGVVPGLEDQIADLKTRLEGIELPGGTLVDLDFEDGNLILVMADGSRVTGPQVADPVDDPMIVLSGGGLAIEGPDLVVTPPTASIQGGTDFAAIFEQAMQ